METEIENIRESNQNDDFDNETEELNLEPVAKKFRFYNSIIDFAAINLIAYFTEMNELVLYPLCFFLYYFIFELIFKATPGKWITKTIVTDCYGNRPSFFSFFIRTISRLIPFEPLSFLSKNGQGWHDFFSKTYVIKR